LKQHLLSEHFLADKGNDLQCEKCEQCQRARELVPGSKMITNDHKSSYSHTVLYHTCSQTAAPFTLIILPLISAPPMSSEGQRWGFGRHLAAAVCAMVLAEDLDQVSDLAPCCWSKVAPLDGEGWNLESSRMEDFYLDLVISECA
jgi:hypothetical protein